MTNHTHLRSSQFSLRRGVLSALLLLIPSARVWADVAGGMGQYQNPVGWIQDIPGFLIAVVDMAFLIIMPIVVCCIIYAGFLFLTAGDNESQLSRAKVAFLWGLVGASVALGAKVLSAVIQSTILDVQGAGGPQP